MMDEHMPWLGEFNWGPRADPFDMAAKEVRKTRWHEMREREREREMGSRMILEQDSFHFRP